MIETGFEPAKRNAADLKPAPFDQTRVLYLETSFILQRFMPPPRGIGEICTHFSCNKPYVANGRKLQV